MVIRSQIVEREWLRLLTDELLKAETASDAFHIFCTAMRSVGFKAAMFVCRASGKDWKHQVTETTYPREWVEHYYSRGYHKTDPTRVYGLLMARPFFWKEMYPRLRKKDLVIFNEIREFGLVSGIAIPAFDAGRLVGGIGLASDTEAVDDDRLKPTLGLAFHFFSAIYDQLIKSEHKVAIDNDIDFPPLTKKEHEVIGRVTFGLNNDEIAEAMNVTRSAVEYHLKNIFAKFGVQNRVSAVVMAIKLGIVDPM